MMERSIKAITTSFAAIVTCGVAITPVLAAAQSTASPHTSAVRYDIAGRVVGTIAPDPDDAGPLGHPATRTTYDNRNMPVLVETGVLNQWQDENTVPENWGADFTLHSSAESFYDSNRRKVKDIARDSSGNIVGLSQYSYDNRGRLECTATRMNPAAYGSIDGINACDLGPVGTGANDFGPDRVTKNIYNAAGEIVQVRTAVGTNVEIASVTYEFTDNGQIEHLIDANGNKAKLEYDGFDRQNKWIFPEKGRAGAFDDSTPTSAVNTAGSPSTTDYEQYAYDANGNRTSLRKRDGWVIEYFYDDLNRMIEKRFPDRPDLNFRAEFDVFYSYDLRGLQTSARFQSPTGAGVLTAYDGFGAVKSEDNMLGGTVQSSYDKNGNRTQVTYPDGETFTHEYDGLNRHKKVLDPAGNALVTYAYNNRGLPESAARLQSAPDQSWTYDNAGRLDASTIATTSTQFDVTWNFTRNPASQILSESISNSSTYSWDGLAGVPEIQPDVQIHRTYTTNGLNQYTDVGGDAFAYDDNGNLTSDGVDTFIYDHENRLVEAYHYDSVSETTYRVILLYDPMGRLMRINSYDPTLERVDFLYDGDALVVETGANGMIQRHVHGPAAGADDPLVSYPGTSVNYGNARFLSTDARGSIVYSADRNDGNRVVNTYDEYGNPGTSNGGRFQYTGQSWLPQLEMYYYKARIYSPKLGRFLQVDPIGYEDQFNLYAYVGNDPINGIDPTGLREVVTQQQLLAAEAQANAELEKAQHKAQRTSSVPLVARVNVATLTLATACSSPPCGRRVFATYTKTNPETKEVYTGKTSIWDASGGADIQIAGRAAVARRDTAHQRLRRLGFGPAVLDKASTDSAAIRGREQNMIDFNGGAKSVGGTSANRINTISDRNPGRGYYFFQMNYRFGTLPSNRNHACGFLTGRCD